MTLADIQAMTPEQIREFVRGMGIAWENGHKSEHSAYDATTVLAIHGTFISTCMARAFMAQPALRDKPRNRR